jgi:TP901 family phage tail tape measure protein
MSDVNRNIKIVIDSMGSGETVDKLRTNIARLTGEMEKLAAAGKINTAEYRKMEDARKKDYQSLDKYEQKTQEVERVLKNLSGATYKELLATRRTLQRQLESETRGTEKYNSTLKKYQQVAAEVKKVTNEMNSAIGCSGQMWDVAKGSFASFFGNIASSLLTRGVGLLRSAVGDAFNTIKNFEQANANLATVLGTSRSEITALTENAKQLGASTEWTAAKIVELQTELAKLGFSEGEILNATEPILGFATALGANLADAAEVSGAALRAFGLNTSETERVVSVMTVAANKSALSFEYIQTSMATIAPVAKAFNFSIEDSMAMLGTLSDAGFDASSAATATRNILLNLADSGGKLAKALGTPIKSLDDLVPALIKLRESGVNLNDTLELTDKRSVAAFNRFLDGAENMAKLRGELNNTEGELERIRKEQLDTLGGSLKLMDSAWEGLMLSFLKSDVFFKSIINWVTALINRLNIAIKSIEQLKAEVLVNAEKEASENAIKEIENLTKAYEKNGRDALEARNKAIDDYLDNTNKGITLLEKKARELESQIYLNVIPGRTKNLEKELDQVNNRIKLYKKEIETVQDMYITESNNTKTYKSPEGSDSKKSPTKPYEAALKALDFYLAEEKNKLKQAYIDKSKYNEIEITDREVFQSELEKLELDGLNRRLKIAGIEPEKRVQIESQIKDAIIKSREDAEKKILELQKKRFEEEEKLAKWHEKETNEKIKAAVDYEDRNTEVQTLDVTEQYANGLMSEQQYQNKLLEIQMQALENKLRVTGLNEKEIGELREEYLQLEMERQKQYWENILSKIDKGKEYLQAGSNTVQALQEAETASAEAEYAKRQTALQAQFDSGIISQEEYNAQKEQLDYEQKSKELEIQKKYADVNFAMQVAQIIATTAQGIITAWATSMQLGPIAGPIMAGVMTALLGVTAAAQIAKAKSERDKVKAMTLESPGGGGGSAPQTGEIRLKQAAEGKYDVIGEDDGRTYKKVPYAGVAQTGYVSSPTLVGERGKELIISDVDLRRLQKHINYPLVVNAINDARRNNVPQRAQGKYNSISRSDAGSNPNRTDSAVIGSDGRVISRMLAILERIEHGDIVVQTNYGITELEAEQRRKQQFESKFTKK